MGWVAGVVVVVMMGEGGRARVTAGGLKIRMNGGNDGEKREARLLIE